MFFRPFTLCTFLALALWALVFTCCVQSTLAGETFDGYRLFKMGQGENLCAVTFDDGPSLHTPRLLDILRDRGIKATFFVVGSQAHRHPDVLLRMQREGHEIANHTNSHSTLRHQPVVFQRAEIDNVQLFLRSLGIISHYLRPPFGRYDELTKAVAVEMGLEIVLWSVDSHDWRRRVRMDTLQSVAGGVAIRGVFLFHDTHAPTVDAMPEILDGLAASQCRFVTVSDYLDVSRPSPRKTVSGEQVSEDRVPQNSDSSSQPFQLTPEKAPHTQSPQTPVPALQSQSPVQAPGPQASLSPWSFSGLAQHLRRFSSSFEEMFR